MEIEGPIFVQADAGEVEPVPVDLELSVEPVITLWAVDTLPVDEHSYVLELGDPGWLSAEALPPQEGYEIFDGGELDQLHDALALALVDGSSLYADDDGDETISVDERAAGPVASTLLSPPPAWMPPSDTGLAEDDGGRLSTEGCNCDGTRVGPAAGWLVVLALIAARRR